MGWTKGAKHLTFSGEPEHLVEHPGRRFDQIRPPCLDLGGSVDGQRPLTVQPLVARKRAADGGFRESGAFVFPPANVKRQKALPRCDLPHMGMINDDQIIARSEIFDGKGLEILQRSLVPNDFDP